MASAFLPSYSRALLNCAAAPATSPELSFCRPYLMYASAAFAETALSANGSRKPSGIFPVGLASFSLAGLSVLSGFAFSRGASATFSAFFSGALSGAFSTAAAGGGSSFFGGGGGGSSFLGAGAGAGGGVSVFGAAASSVFGGSCLGASAFGGSAFGGSVFGGSAFGTSLTFGSSLTLPSSAADTAGLSYDRARCSSFFSEPPRPISASTPMPTTMTPPTASPAINPTERLRGASSSYSS